MDKLKFLKCETCGNVVLMVNNAGPVPECCGSPMEELTVNEKDAVFEKHLPVITEKGTCVVINIGEKAHPMTEEHYIMWIILITDDGAYARELYPGDSPEAVFSMRSDEEVIGAYAFCNIHGLWFKGKDRN